MPDTYQSHVGAPDVSPVIHAGLIDWSRAIEGGMQAGIQFADAQQRTVESAMKMASETAMLPVRMQLAQAEVSKANAEVQALPAKLQLMQAQTGAVVASTKAQELENSVNDAYIQEVGLQEAARVKKVTQQTQLDLLRTQANAAESEYQFNKARREQGPAQTQAAFTDLNALRAKVQRGEADYNDACDFASTVGSKYPLADMDKLIPILNESVTRLGKETRVIGGKARSMIEIAEYNANKKVFEGAHPVQLDVDPDTGAVAYRPSVQYSWDMHDSGAQARDAVAVFNARVLQKASEMGTTDLALATTELRQDDQDRATSTAINRALARQNQLQQVFTTMPGGDQQATDAIRNLLVAAKVPGAEAASGVDLMRLALKNKAAWNNETTTLTLPGGNQVKVAGASLIAASANATLAKMKDARDDARNRHLDDPTGLGLSQDTFGMFDAANPVKRGFVKRAGTWAGQSLLSLPGSVLGIDRADPGAAAFMDEGREIMAKLDTKLKDASLDADTRSQIADVKATLTDLLDNSTVRSGVFDTYANTNLSAGQVKLIQDMMQFRRNMNITGSGYAVGNSTAIRSRIRQEQQNWATLLGLSNKGLLQAEKAQDEFRQLMNTSGAVGAALSTSTGVPAATTGGSATSSSANPAKLVGM